MLTCPSCGKQNPDDARFCNACATPLAGEAAPLREERKFMTVLFADLVGFTSRAERLDPEDVRALLGPYHARLRAELERFGGTVEKFIGDAVMALFGAPVAHEDDPERAVRAALAIREWVLEDGELDLRIGVNTGEALVTLGARPAAGEGIAAGDVVNSAARLQTAAPVNGVFVGEATYRTTRHLFDYREAGRVEAKGKEEPIAAWEAIAPRAKLGVDVVQTGRAPLIGRDQELALLLGTVHRTSDDREPHLVTIVGVPGIGKSRLTFELFRAVTADDAVVWRQGRCLPYGGGGLWAIGEIVKSHAQILENDPAERAEEKLRRAVAAALTDEDEADWIERHLRPLLGIGDQEPAPGHVSRADAFAAWRRFFEALADEAPLVLVIEDLHWADDQLLDFLDHLVDWAGHVPLLLVGTARPELLERRSGWGGGKANVTTLSLRPLSEEDTTRLLAANLARPVLESELHGALLERAGGNPLYAEQYALMLAERADRGVLSVPETVQAIIAARLDGLSAGDKDLLHAGAVQGKVFWAGAVAAMTGGDPMTVDERLHALERKELVRRQRRSSVAGEAEYAFRHILLRDVAYGQIPRRARGEKHRLVAEWIDSVVEDRDDHVELLAEHYERALELARAVGGDETVLAERARFAFRDAGERTFALGAASRATPFYERALALWPADDPERPALLFELAASRAEAEHGGALEAAEARDAFLACGDHAQAARAEALLSEVMFWEGRGDEAIAHAQRARELVRDVPASRAKARVLATHAFRHLVRGEVETALADARELQDIAHELGSEYDLVDALQLLGLVRVELGDLDGLEDLEHALALARKARSPLLSATAGSLAVHHIDLGRLDRASTFTAEARKDAVRLGDAPTIRWIDVLEMRQQYWRGNWDDALQLAESVLAAEPMNPRCYTVRCEMHLARDRVAAALEDAGRALELGRASDVQQAVHPALAVSARARLAAADRAASLEAVDELLERFVTEGTQQASASLPDLAVTAVELGRSDALREAIATIKKQTLWTDAARTFAELDFAGAAARYAEIGSRPDAAYAWLCTAHALVEQGRGDEADKPLQDALAFFRSVGATRYIREGERLIAATA